ncbi:MAG: SDR family oxidoreductase [Gammaproteobacteria bacterium]|nr:SDR family oxidoreductase [Gammaproteobacteria bacterium]
MQDRFSLAGRTAMVTGASSGLGRHFADTLAAAGATVVLGARRRRRLDEAVDQIAAVAGRAFAVDLDVTDPGSVTAAFAAAEAECGLIDIVINNAGTVTGGRAEETLLDDWQMVVDTNLTGVHLVAAEAARRLIAGGRPGSLVTIASILGLRVSPGNAAYNATKAAVIQLTKSQALEWARHGIRVNAICPGYFETELNQGFLQSERGQAMVRRIPLRRVGRLEELDGLLLLLASDAGSFITGSAMVIDGGHLCSSL